MAGSLCGFAGVFGSTCTSLHLVANPIVPSCDMPNFSCLFLRGLLAKKFCLKQPTDADSGVPIRINIAIQKGPVYNRSAEVTLSVGNV